MKIDSLTPNDEILNELGRRLARVRKQQGWSQDRLAEEAGLGVATLRRIESGQDSQLESWLKILKALRMSASIEQLLPEKYDSPMAEALASNKRRQARVADSAPGIAWGDEN
ncbi:MAG: helix-turn-helix transcriptional regulator [Woeseia sp.]